MSLEEALLDKVRRLPPSKQEQVLHFAGELDHPSQARKVPSRDRHREIAWIQQNRARVAGQWVVVDGDRLVAAHADGHQAFAAAKAEGIEVPFLVHVLPEEPWPFGPARRPSSRPHRL
jgi:hypothetical protein